MNKMAFWLCTLSCLLAACDGSLKIVNARPFDAGAVDTIAIDAGAVDASAGDASMLDTGVVDAGAADSRLIDAGARDSSASDASDAGLLDSGQLDRGAALDATSGDAAGPTFERHYVTQDGAGDTDGRTLTNAWSLEQFNNAAQWSPDTAHDNLIGPGETVFFHGQFTSEIKPAGSGTAAARITLDGYEAGELDMRQHHCEQCAKSSQRQRINVYGFNILGQRYLTVQDFEIEECNLGFRIAEDAAYIVVRRNILHDTLDDGVLIASSNNVVVGGARGDGNHLYDCGSGTGAADVCSTNADYVVVSYNWLEGGVKPDRGIDGVTLNSYSNNWLIEYNLIESHNDEVNAAPEPYTGGSHHGLEGPGEDGVDIKHQCHNVVIRGNVIRSHYYQTGITVHGRGYNVYVTGNVITDNKTGLLVFTNPNDASDEPPPRNIHVWANLFYENHAAAVSLQRSPAGGSDPREPHHLAVANNVFWHNVLNDHPLTTISSVTSANNWFAGLSHHFVDVNNVFMDNRPNENLRHHEVFTHGDWSTFDSDVNSLHSHNSYFDSAGPSYFRWYNADGSYTSHDLAWVQSQTALGAESYDRDPGMSDPAALRFWPASADADMVDSGLALSDELLPGRMCFLEDESVCVELSYATALDVDSDFAVVPPDVRWCAQGAYGDGWERGAYVHEVR